MRLYNQVLVELAQEFDNAYILDTGFIVTPVHDTSADWNHYRNVAGKEEARYVLSQLCRKTNEQRTCLQQCRQSFDLNLPEKWNEVRKCQKEHLNTDPDTINKGRDTSPLFWNLKPSGMANDTCTPVGYSECVKQCWEDR